MTLQQPRHSPHGFGVLSLEDVPFMFDTLHRVADEFDRRIVMLEIGVANGGTTIGIYNHCKLMGWGFNWVGLDMVCGRPAFDLGDWGKFICGDCHSPEVINQVMKEGEFNFIFIDGCHCRECVRLDFVLYSPLLVSGGLLAFHDTCPATTWQNHHIQCQPDRFIETRAALEDLKLLPCRRSDYNFIAEQAQGETQGMILYRKI